MKKTLILYGAGQNGLAAERYIREFAGNMYSKIYFCDSSFEKIGAVIDGVEVIDINSVKSLCKNENCEIVITPACFWEVFEFCIEKGIPLPPAEKCMVWDSERQRISEFMESMSKSVYSLSGEDLFLRNYFRDKQVGTYVDIGVYDPVKFSNTYWAYVKGWRGINIDPNPLAIERTKRIRPEDISINVGVSDTEEFLTYYMFRESAINTFDIKIKERYEERGEIINQKEVQVRRLEDILRECNVGEIDFMDIDVERWEEKVIVSNDWNIYRPKIVLIEQFADLADIFRSEVYLFMKEQNYEVVSKYRDTLIYEDKLRSTM